MAFDSSFEQLNPTVDAFSDVDNSELFSGEGNLALNESGLAGPVNQLLAQSEGGQFILDPLDIFGTRAEETADTINTLLTGSVKAGITEKERQLSKIEQLQKPFRDVALETALPSLTALATGVGETGFTSSKLFQLQADQGTRAIKRRLAAQGKFSSSQRFEETGDLLSKLAAEDVGRFEAGNLAQLQVGIGSTAALNKAGLALGTSGKSLLSTLGESLSTTQTNLGAQRKSSFEGAANTISGLSTLISQNQG